MTSVSLTRDPNADALFGKEQTAIGKRIIHREQVAAGDEILRLFASKKGPPLLISQPQQGKTDVCIYVIDRFIKSCELEGLSWGVFYLINKIDNTILQQTDDRLTEADFDREAVEIYHLISRDIQPTLSSPDKIKQIRSLDRRLIIIDECHEALRFDGPLAKFLENFGICYGKPTQLWDDKRNYVLSVSATPFPQVIRNISDAIESGAFSLVPLKLNDSYYSLEKLYKSGRLHESGALIEHGRPTPFLKKRITDFVDNNKGQLNCGYLVIRSIKAGPDIIKNYIRKTYGDAVSCIEFSAKADSDYSISQFESSISRRTKKPCVALIRGTARAGKTLKSTEHIRGWVESPDAKGDTSIQAVGRSLGYGKDGQTYPIYCHLNQIKIGLEFYKYVYDEKHPQCACPTGAHSKGNARSANSDYMVCVAETKEQIPTEHSSIQFNDKTSNIGSKTNKEDYTSANDRCLDILHMRPHRQYNEKDRVFGLPRAIHDDGPPTNELYRETYFKVCNKFQGMGEEGNRWFYFVKTDTKQTFVKVGKKPNDEMIGENTILRRSL